MNKLIATKDLSKAVTSVLKSYKSVFAKLHVVTLSAIHAACAHGNPAELNRIQDGLNSNDRQALRLYVRRISIANGLSLDGKPDAAIEGIPTEVATAMFNRGAVFGYEKGQFTVIKGHTSDEAKNLAVLVSNRFLNPDGKLDTFVFERNNIAEIKTLGDDDVLKQIMKLAKEADQSTDKRVSAVSATVKNFLKDIAGKAEVMQQQLTLNRG